MRRSINMWYILKPILLTLFCLIVIVYKIIEYVCVLLFRLFFFFKWTKYSSINNNEGDFYYVFSDDDWSLESISKDSEEYSEEKSPIESLRKFYAELKSI